MNEFLIEATLGGGAAGMRPAPRNGGELLNLTLSLYCTLYPAPPWQLWMGLTTMCNQRCLHCYAKSAPDQHGQMGRSLAFRLLHEAAEMGFKVVQFTGGDPLPILDSWKFHKPLQAGQLLSPGFADPCSRCFDARFQEVEERRADNITVSIYSENKPGEKCGLMVTTAAKIVSGQRFRV